MPRRNSDSDRSAFFFMGAFEPAEIANFNLQNIFLPGDDGVLEVLGHGIGVWWGSRFARDFNDLRDATRDWLETTAAVYFLSTGSALGVRLGYWVEAIDANVKEAVVGFFDTRFRIISAPSEDAPANERLRRAVDLAGALRGRTHAHPAAKEAWRSALDPSDEAFLSAFRSLECLRRLYGEGESDDDVKGAWTAMQQDLQGDPETYAALREAAKAIRHGDRPSMRAQGHVVNVARDRREELLGYATALVRAKLGRELGVVLCP